MNRREIDGLSWRMSEVYADCVDKILVNLARHFQFIKEGEPISNAWKYQIRKLAEMDAVTQETAQIILNTLGGADETLQGLLIESIQNGLKDAEPTLRKAAEKGLLKGPVSQIAPNQMQAFRAYYKQSADKLNLVNTVMLDSTQNAYRATVSDIASKIDTTQGILNTSTGEVITGVNSFNKVQRDAVRRMVDNGLTGFIDHGGHHWSPEAYVAMDMRTTMSNTARAAVFEQADEFGVGLYQVSHHNGARPLCYPWQGKVISRNGWTGEVQDDDGNPVQVHSEDEIESFQYGGGLFGVNCGHYPIPFIPGFSRIRPPEQDEKANAKEYAESQQQRALERNVRNEKRELEVMRAQGADKADIDAQKTRVKEANADLDQFCKDTGRARRPERTATPINATFPDGYKQTYYERGVIRRNPNTPTTSGTPTQAKSDYVTKTLANSGIKEVPLTKWASTPTTQEIIDSLGGADQTKGSCSSLAFAWAGNRGGYDVHDFRDGVSRYHFSACNNIDTIAQLPGVDGVVLKNPSDFTTAHEMMKQMEKGKEYYFGVAKHAAIVRQTDAGYEYLELQSATNNGWHTLNDERLRHRFGCQRSHSTYGMKYSVPGELIEVDKLKGNPEFVKVLEYINTPVNEQRKGFGGGIK